MTGATATATPAAEAAGNATLLSAQPPEQQPDQTPPAENQPAQPEPTEPPAEQPSGQPKVGPGEGEQPAEGDGDKPDEKAAPESYEFTAPEGVTLDPAAVEEFTPIAKELKLSQEQAQKLVGVVAGISQRQAEQHAAQVAEWAKQVTTDKEIGGDKWAENRALVARARDQFASPELLTLMDSTGLGNHPAVIKHFVNLGKAIADDGHVTGGAPSRPVDFASDFYARMPH